LEVVRRAGFERESPAGARHSSIGASILKMRTLGVLHCSEPQLRTQRYGPWLAVHLAKEVGICT
jgi:hypothetical protein